jgi:hypothetical protein
VNLKVTRKRKCINISQDQNKLIPYTVKIKKGHNLKKKLNLVGIKAYVQVNKEINPREAEFVRFVTSTECKTATDSALPATFIVTFLYSEQKSSHPA